MGTRRLVSVSLYLPLQCTMGLSTKSFFLAFVILGSILAAVRSTYVSYDDRAITIDGRRRIINSGAIHYPRSTPGMWPDLIRKAKEGGLDAIETYVFWNGHEPRPREYYFEGNYDLIRFLKEIQHAGLYAILRIGPYVCAEWTYGGLPAWLRKIPGLHFRTDNRPFENEMQNFTTYIVNKVKEANLFAGQGGPIILAQIENEYGNIWDSFDWKYGRQARYNYIKWCADMAERQDVGVPWIMCQQREALPNILDTCNNFYCDGWYPWRKGIPKMWTENWVGWFKAWTDATPTRPAEDVAFAVARFYQRGGVLQNYYMYHGGTNFGRTAGGPFIATTYDYDAPLDEYGNLRQPKWGHLKELHAVLKSMEEYIVYGEVSNSYYGSIQITKFALEGSAACLISNNDKNLGFNVSFEGATYYIPKWSVSFLPDCTTVVYNTAKVKTQKSVMVKKPNTEEAEPQSLQWSWLPENLGPTLTDEYGSLRANQLLEQVLTTADESDYLWYMTSVHHYSQENFTLYVKTAGYVLYAFVNGELVGQQYGLKSHSFEFRAPITLQAGKNYISLLSATVGTENYGAMFEDRPTGIAGGPVKLIGANNAAIDLSGNSWSYKTGLHGEDTQIHLDKPGVTWRSGVLQTRRPFTWYKTTFQSPAGYEPVVVDLLGLGKGMAWVNGNSLGRYWPTSIAQQGWPACIFCPYSVDGKYDPGKMCRTDCYQPAQRWYHVPRSFLNAGEPNTLILFEEAGGDPSQVNFQMVSEGPVCVNVEKGETFTLSCQLGKTISSINYASFGAIRGQCGQYAGGCESKSAFDIISKACVGKESCSVQYTDLFLNGCDCDEGASDVFTIQATC